MDASIDTGILVRLLTLGFWFQIIALALTVILILLNYTRIAVCTMTNKYFCILKCALLRN